MPHQLRRLALVFAVAFALIALTGGYWNVLQRDDLLARADNPRRLLLAQRFQRGTIYDRNDAVLAESSGAPGNFVRRYPYPPLAPVLGYFSPLYGLAGIEASADGVLHGDAGYDALELYWRNDILSAPPPGRAVRLSIDLRLQTVADTELGERAGAIVLLDTTTGDILALASHPTYDANLIDEQGDTLAHDPRALMLNRATLAQYQPGGALQPVILAAALQAGIARSDEQFSIAAAMPVNGHTLNCVVTPGHSELTLATAFQAGCPQPFADLGVRLGALALDRVFAEFRLYDAPSLAIPTIAYSRTALSENAVLAAIGQSDLNITPLQLALVTAALARHGAMPTPRLLIAQQGVDDNWQSVETAAPPTAIQAPEYANQVKALMRSGHTALALSGPAGNPLAWFSGFAPPDEARYVVAVLLENGDAEAAASIGRKVLESATQKK